MARLVINAGETWQYVLPEDRDAEGNARPGCPVFTFGHLSNTLRQHIQDTVINYKVNEKGADQKADVYIKTGTRDRLAVRFGVKDVTIDGKRPEWFRTTHFTAFNATGLTDDTLDVLRYELDKLGNEIWGRQTLTEQEAKN